MTAETFGREIARLQSEWPKAYGEARRKALWEVFKSVPDAVFTATVTVILLDPPGYAPGKNFMEEIIQTEMVRWQRGETQRTRTGRYEPTPPEGKFPSLARVKEYVRQVLDGKAVPADDKPKFAERDRNRLAQLRMLAPQDRAANDRGDE